MSVGIDGQSNNGRGSLPETRWSLVMRAGGGGAVSDSERKAALAEIFRRYQPALRAHLIARRTAPERADDLVQGFIADKIVERNLLAHADQRRGGFRAFLFTSLNNYVSNQFRSDASARRKPAAGNPISIDDSAVQIGEETGADMFDVAWARETMAEALKRMRAGCLADSRQDLWEVFDVRVLSPALDGSEPMAYEHLVERFNFADPKAAANAMITAKRRFAQSLRSVLAEYVTSEEGEKELEEELQILGAILARSRR